MYACNLTIAGQRQTDPLFANLFTSEQSSQSNSAHTPCYFHYLHLTYVFVCVGVVTHMSHVCVAVRGLLGETTPFLPLRSFWGSSSVVSLDGKYL